MSKFSLLSQCGLLLTNTTCEGLPAVVCCFTTSSSSIYGGLLAAVSFLLRSSSALSRFNIGLRTLTGWVSELLFRSVVIFLIDRLEILLFVEGLLVTYIGTWALNVGEPCELGGQLAPPIGPWRASSGALIHSSLSLSKVFVPILAGSSIFHRDCLLSPPVLLYFIRDQAFQEELINGRTLF